MIEHLRPTDRIIDNVDEAPQFCTETLSLEKRADEALGTEQGAKAVWEHLAALQGRV